MSHFTTDPRSCRVDIWRDTGKWYTTIAVVFENAHYTAETSPHHALADALRRALPQGTFSGMTATCLAPYHTFSHPISVRMDDVWTPGAKL